MGPRQSQGAAFPPGLLLRTGLPLILNTTPTPSRRNTGGISRTPVRVLTTQPREQTAGPAPSSGRNPWKARGLLGASKELSSFSGGGISPHYARTWTWNFIRRIPWEVGRWEQALASVLSWRHGISWKLWYINIFFWNIWTITYMFDIYEIWYDI